MRQSMKQGDALLNETEAGRRLGFSVRTLQGWRIRGGGPPFLKMSRRAVRYRASDLEAWIRSRVRTSTSDQGIDYQPSESASRWRP